MTETPDDGNLTVKPNLTVDTNFVFEAWEERPRTDAVSCLLDWANKGMIDVVVTARIEQDVPHNPLANRIRDLPNNRITSTFPSRAAETNARIFWPEVPKRRR